MNTITKVCKTCKEKVDINNFHTDKRSKDGHIAKCKLCISKYNHNLRQVVNKQHYKDYYNKNKDKLNLACRTCNHKLKLEVLNHYTNGNIRCQCPSGQCTETHEEFMTIDHINGGGNQHRKSIKRNGIAFYRWLKQNDYPLDFRVLCMNCNHSLGMRGYCPHS